MLAAAERPAIIAGTDVYWDGAWDALRTLVETMRVPTFANGLGRGCLPADHELAFSRTRSFLKTDADVVMVIGTPLDFRISFGHFGDAQIIHVVDSAEQRAAHVPDGGLTGRRHRLDPAIAMAEWSGTRRDHDPWIDKLRDAETSAAAGELDRASKPTSTPIKPTRVYGEVRTDARPRRGRGVRRW